MDGEHVCRREEIQMVISSEEYRRRRDELETRISKMISEGGMAVDANYFHDERILERQNNSEKIEMAKTKMISEGGLGAEYYYHDKELHEVDVIEQDQPLN